ncbi:MAG: acyl carrier protein [Candidatus Omnitrophica bacterium]|nr:acyl carrier protein [Candidatus Omnitrophota bacterium]MCG2704847.1 acyl carrier protein [Candidatus Omnitrophota bacterium]
MSEDIKGKIRKFIVDNYLKRLQDNQLKDNDSFLEQGIIDSIGVIELTNFIQKAFRIEIEVSEIIPDNFDTLNNLERYITKKLRKDAK